MYDNKRTLTARNMVYVTCANVHSSEFVLIFCCSIPKTHVSTLKQNAQQQEYITSAKHVVYVT
jgi:hypothetical protein